MESGLFGLVSSTSAELYKDTIYYWFSPSDPRRNEVRGRTLPRWLGIYTVKAVEALFLFGTYDAVRIPASRLAIEVRATRQGCRERAA